MKRSFMCVLSSIVLATAVTTALAQPAAPAPKPASRPASLTVAVLDFDASTPGNPDLGKQISETLTVTLSGENGFVLVERAAMARTLQEHELNLTGVVNQDQATKIGQLVGAKILIVGKAFALDKQLFITAKIIGTETSLVEGVLVQGARDGEVSKLVMDLSGKLAERLRTAGPKIVAVDESVVDPVPALKAKLANKKLPKLSIEVRERHVAAAHAAGIDPAVETEVRMLLKSAGFEITDTGAAKTGVEVQIKGEAFSEFSARIGNLVSCAARVEIKMVGASDDKLLFADRETTRAVDLSENIAGKTALQKAGRVLAIRILQNFADTLPDKAAGQ